MLQVIHSLRDICFQKLTKVYSEALQENGIESYSYLSPELQIMESQQDFYAFLKEYFKTDGAFYCVWAEEDQFLSALRMEPYQDGFLLEAFETDPTVRNCGFGSKLMDAVLHYAKEMGIHKIYSHIHRENTASITVHKKTGFQKILDHAVYIDGSVTHQCFTYLVCI